MPKRSAGILMYRGQGSALEVLLVHPGGPFWAKKDTGAWSIPKGEYDADEDPLACAIREFEEELGSPPPKMGSYLDLGEVTRKGSKTIVAFAVAGDFDPAKLKSNRFELEWPPRSGRMQSFPEVDRAACSRRIPPARRFCRDRSLSSIASLRAWGMTRQHAEVETASL